MLHPAKSARQHFINTFLAKILAMWKTATLLPKQQQPSWEMGMNALDGMTQTCYARSDLGEATLRSVEDENIWLS